MLEERKDIDAVADRLTRSHARRAGQRGDAARQARLRAEAAHLVGARVAASRRSSRPPPEWSRRWATRGTPWRARGASWRSCAPAILGPIRDVHIWTDRPVGYWAQGIPRPGSPVPAVRPPDPASPPLLERAHGGRRRAARHGRQPAVAAARPGLGSLLRARTVDPLSPGVPPVHLARLGELRRGRRSATWAPTSWTRPTGRSASRSP